jgi:dephospho-CoA kinase
MRKVALTGGIATGKSYCLARFAAFGAPVLDADQLARDAVAPGSPGLAAVAARFGREMIGESGALDRPRLAAVVFLDPAARRDLEAIVHPVVYRAIADWYAGLEASGAQLGIVDVPLLFESGHAEEFDRVVVVACTEDAQVQRMMARSGLTEREARARLGAQWPIAEKVHAADVVIDTNGAFQDTDQQVDVIWQELTKA